MSFREKAKVLAAAGAVLSLASVATPANAWWAINYYDASGHQTGYAAYCDSGTYLGGWGTGGTTYTYDYSHIGEGC